MIRLMALALFGAFCIGLGLGGCTPAQERTACIIDQAGQIVIVPLEAVGSALEPLAAIPVALAHAAAQAGCAVVLGSHTSAKPIEP